MSNALAMARRILGRLILFCIRWWVLLFGREVTHEAWLDGVDGPSATIGPAILDDVVRRDDLVAERVPSAGLLRDFDELAGPRFDPRRVHADVHEFYEHTASYGLGVEPHWAAPMGLLARTFVAAVGLASDQCNVPLDAKEAAAGMTNEVVALRRRDGESVSSCWMRRNKAHGRVVFAGFYGVGRPPREAGPCVRVSFPFPHAYACVILRPTVRGERDLELVSAGKAFGESGFYIVQIDRRGRRFAKKVPLVERIRVGIDAAGELFAAHRFEFLIPFLRLDYALKRAS